MKTAQQSAFSDQLSAPTLNAPHDDVRDPAPARPERSYDFFGNSELLIAES